MTESFRIVFIGTPEFAAYSLEKLIEYGFNVVAVITAPDKPAGRGMLMQQSAVKQMALKHHIDILQPTNLKNPDFLNQLKNYNADFQIVIAFRMLPEQVWNMPRLGTMNLHASLLPDYRGAAPINHVLINGEKVTGVTTFLLKHQIDTGDILLQQKVDIMPEDDAATLHNKLMQQGAELVVQSATLIKSGKYRLLPQSMKAGLHHAPKIFKEDCEINWHKTSVEIINLIRGLSPYPCARTIFENKVLKIYRAEPAEYTHLKAGEAMVNKNEMIFGTGNKSIRLLDVQPEGKRRMTVQEYLRGRNN